MPAPKFTVGDDRRQLDSVGAAASLACSIVEDEQTLYVRREDGGPALVRVERHGRIIQVIPVHDEEAR